MAAVLAVSAVLAMRDRNERSPPSNRHTREVKQVQAMQHQRQKETRPHPKRKQEQVCTSKSPRPLPACLILSMNEGATNRLGFYAHVVCVPRRGTWRAGHAARGRGGGCAACHDAFAHRWRSPLRSRPDGSCWGGGCVAMDWRGEHHAGGGRQGGARCGVVGRRSGGVRRRRALQQGVAGLWGGEFYGREMLCGIRGAEGRLEKARGRRAAVVLIVWLHHEMVLLVLLVMITLQLACTACRAEELLLDRVMNALQHGLKAMLWDGALLAVPARWLQRLRGLIGQRCIAARRAYDTTAWGRCKGCT
eukprot:1140710-Pelagomonas_calceolata.AAC.11